MAILVFPGQGVQRPGMGGALPSAAPEVFAEASEVTGADIESLCAEGSSGQADLSSTRWAQIAVLTCSVAASRSVQLTPTAVAGHSVGEYAAFVTAGAIGLSDALGLIDVRGRATDEAGRATPSGMAAVGRIDRDAVDAICAETGASLAADNAPGQLVISGPVAALESAMAAVKEAGGIAKRLDVAAGFHSAVMAPAADAIRDALTSADIRDPALEVWSPTTAARVGSSADIERILVDQLTSPVNWRQTVEALAEAHGPSFVDLGPGKVAAGLVRKTVRDADVRTLADLMEAHA